MAEHDPFRGLSELRGEPPSRAFVEGLESQLRGTRAGAGREVAGPANPSDQKIEGVVPMPEPLKNTRVSRRWIPVAAAAVVVVIGAVVAIVATSDDDERPADIGPDVEETDIDPPPTEAPGPAPADKELGEAWLAAIGSGDMTAFEALHTADATVSQNLMGWDLVDLGFDGAGALANYVGSVAALRASLDVDGDAFDALGCEAGTEPSSLTCRFSHTLPGPDVNASVEVVADLAIDAGRIGAVSLAGTTEPAELWASRSSFLDDGYVTLLDRECIAVGFSSGDCGTHSSSWNARYLAVSHPDLLPEPTAGQLVAQQWHDAIYVDDLAAFQALHAPDAAVEGTPFSAEPSGSLGDPAIATQYWGGFEGLQAALATGHTIPTRTPCLPGDAEGEFECYEAGPRVEGFAGPIHYIVWNLTVVDGLVQEMRFVVEQEPAQVAFADDLFGNRFDEVLAVVTPEELACLPDFNSRECGALWVGISVKLAETFDDPTWVPE